jgi:hypothetical protein
MLTWLDRYVRDAGHYFKTHCAHLYPEIKKRYPWAGNDVGITGLLSFHRFVRVNLLMGVPVTQNPKTRKVGQG